MATPVEMPSLGMTAALQGYFGAPSVSQWLKNLFPPLQWFPITYGSLALAKQTVLADIVGGITVGALLVPQSMAYALLAGLQPIDGLYASTVALFVYPFLGSARVASIGPVALAGLLTAATIGQVLSEEEIKDEELYRDFAIVLAFVSGLLQMFMGLARMGIIVRFLSYSVMTGFTSAAALVIGLSQFKFMFGIKVPRFEAPFSNIKVIGHMFGHLDETNPYTLFLSFGSLAILAALKIWKGSYWPKIVAASVAASVAAPEEQSVKAKTPEKFRPSASVSPETVDDPVSVVATEGDLDGNGVIDIAEGKISIPYRILKVVADMSALMVTILGCIWAIIYEAAGVDVRSSRGLNLTELDVSLSDLVEVVGDVPSGFPPLRAPDLGLLSEGVDTIISGSFVIGIIAFMELFAVGKVYAERDKYKIDANQELLALGAANVAGSFFGGMPVGGAFSRTAVAGGVGAKSPIYGAFVGLVVVLGLVLFADWGLFYYIPMGGLAAIIMVAVSGLVKYNDFIMAWRLNKGDFAAMSMTFLGTFCLSITEGILIGMFLSVVIQLKRTAFLRVPTLGQVKGSLHFKDLQRQSSESQKLIQVRGVVILRPHTDIYFANTDDFAGAVKGCIEEGGNARETRVYAVVIACHAVSNTDLQGIITIRKLVKELGEREPPVRLLFAELQPLLLRTFIASGLFAEVEAQMGQKSKGSAVEPKQSGSRFFWHQLTDAVDAARAVAIEDGRPPKDNTIGRAVVHVDSGYFMSAATLIETQKKSS